MVASLFWSASQTPAPTLPPLPRAQVTEDVLLYGFGIFGTGDKYKGNIFVTSGNNASGDKLAVVEAEVEKKTSPDIEPFFFDAPLLLSAGEQYHVAQEHKTNHSSGYYCDRGAPLEAGGREVAGVRFEFKQTSEGRNNGSSIDRGQIPVFFFKKASDVARARRRATPGGGASGLPSGAEDDVLPAVDAAPLAVGISAGGVADLLAIVDWAQTVLSAPPPSPAPVAALGGLASPRSAYSRQASPAQELAAAAKLALTIALRTLGRNLVIPESAPAPGSTAGVSGASAALAAEALLPAPSEVEAELRRQRREAGSSDEDGGGAPAGASAAAPKTPGGPPAWLPKDAATQATTLWQVDRALRRTMALETLDEAVRADARAAYVQVRARIASPC